MDLPLPISRAADEFRTCFGKRINDVSTVEVGDLIFADSVTHENVPNVMRVTHIPDGVGGGKTDRFYAVFCALDNPAERRIACDHEFCVWGFTLPYKEYHTATPKQCIKAALKAKQLRG